MGVSAQPSPGDVHLCSQRTQDFFPISQQLLGLEFGKEKGILDGETYSYSQILSELSYMVKHTKYVYFGSLGLK